jgi:hypothetical protein
MQLHLETEELNVVANLLMELPGETSRARPDERLLEMVLARDLRFDSDELERMAALLAADEHRLKDMVVYESNAARRAEMQQKLALLERVLEKVAEACAMI